MPSAFDASVAAVRGGADRHAEAVRLVAAMTLEEQLGCLDGDVAFWPGVLDMASGGYHRHTFPAAAVARLGIPGIAFSDGPRGCVVGTATCFPVSMARGASFDPALEREVGEAIGAELAAAGANFTGAVCMNLLRHPAWGRAQETYGEDPHHVGVMAGALTEGLQHHVMACMKHFACNSMENARFQVDVRVDERALHEVYLPHFRAVAEAGVASVMSAYNSVNGAWCGENRPLLTEVLRDEWGWDGFVVSDFIFGVRDGVESVEAGLDIEMPFRHQRARSVPGALERGELAPALVAGRVRAVVAGLLRHYATAPEPPPRSVLACDRHRRLARRVASASTVLLRNEGSLLPLDPASLRRVAVVGRLAAVPNLGDGGSSDVHPPDTVTLLQGLRAALPGVTVDHRDDDPHVAAGADVCVVVVGYTKRDEGEYIDFGANPELAALFPPADDPELGMRPDPPGGTGDGAAPASEAPSAAGGAAAAGPGPATAAEAEDAGDSGQAPDMVSGGDRASLRLHVEDEKLVEAVAAVNPRTVVVVMAGSAVVVPWVESVPAVVLVWYPGMEGGHALADVLLGREPPGGFLPFAVPRHDEDLVPFDAAARSVVYDLFHGQWKLDRDGVAPAFPFGFGLGYTTFALGAPRLIQGDDPVDLVVSVPVTNTGSRPGACLVLVFAGMEQSAYPRPAARLLAFEKATLAPSASVELSLPCSLRTVAVRRDGRFEVEAGTYALTVGRHAGDPAASRLEVTVG